MTASNARRRSLKRAVGAIALIAGPMAMQVAGAQAQSFNTVIAVEQRMAQPDYGAVGLDIALDANGALVSEGMWEGMTRRRAATLMTMAGQQTGIAALDTLYMQTLAVAAGSPRRDEEREAEATGNAWLEARVSSLVARGHYDAAVKLGNRLGTAGRAANPVVERDLLNAVLWGQGLGPACAVSWRLEAQARTGSDPELQLLDAACKAHKGDRAAAEFAAELASELGAGNSTAINLLDHMIGLHRGKPKPKLLKTAASDPLSFAMAGALNMDWPVALYDQLPAAVLAGFASRADISLPNRIVAAELARASGFGTRNQLRDLYMQAAAALAAGEVTPTQASAAILDRANSFATWRQSQDPVIGADQLADLLARSQAQGRFDVMADLLLHDFSFPQAEATLSKHAGIFARAAMAANMPNRAGTWLAILLKGQEAGVFFLDPNVRAVWPLLILSKLPVNEMVENGALPWLASLSEEDRPKAALVFSMAEALGRRVPEPAWLTLQDGATPDVDAAALPPLPYWRGIAAAASRGSRAEVIIFANLLLQTNRDELAHPAIISSVLSALRGIGATDIAHQIAVETALKVGF